MALPRTYFGLACKNGHTGPRYASNGGCIECAKDSKSKNLVLSNVHPDDRQRLIDYAESLRVWRAGK